MTGTAELWALPPRAKVYEALSAIADGRVRVTGASEAEVTSSSGEKTYTVRWSEDGSIWSANDSASYWRRYAGYPIVAVLLVTGRIGYDAGLAALLAGVPWKRLNEAARRDYDRVVDDVLREVARKGGDREALVEQVEGIYARLAALGLRRGSRGAPPRRRARPAGGIQA